LRWSKNAEAFSNLARVQAARERYAESIALQRRPLTSGPNDPQILSSSLAATEQYSEAVVYLRRAVEVNPALALALLDLAWISRRPDAAGGAALTGRASR
jgi:tetratricopeptide (TPR) repeat protein